MALKEHRACVSKTWLSVVCQYGKEKIEGKKGGNENPHSFSIISMPGLQFAELRLADLGTVMWEP